MVLPPQPTDRTIMGVAHMWDHVIMPMLLSLPVSLRSEADRQAVSDTVTALAGHWPVERVVLFGSKARGDDDPESDIDLLVINSTEPTAAEEAAMHDTAWDAGIRYGKVVQLVIRSHERWWHGIDQATPLRRQIDQDGLEVYRR